MIPEAATKLSYQFLVGHFAPAALLTGAAVAASGWAPQVRTDGGSALDVTTLAAAIFVSSIALAVVLQVMNPFFIRLFEGAAGLPAPVAGRWRERHVQRLRQLTKKIVELKAGNTRADEDEAYRLERERYLSFPSTEGDVLPTGLGNVMAAWEHYPYRRYGIDAITMWPRLAPLLSKPVSDAIVWAKARFDLLLNALILLPIWGVVRLIAFSQQTWRGWLWLVAMLAAVPLIWRLCLAAARGWGETVKAAFDLHRLDVLKQIGVLAPPAGWPAADEAAIWRELQWSMKFDHAPKLTIVPRRGPDKGESPEADRDPR